MQVTRSIKCEKSKKPKEWVPDSTCCFINLTTPKGSLQKKSVKFFTLGGEGGSKIGLCYIFFLKNMV